MNQEERIQAEYEEINLMDYIKVLLKRKWLILAIFFGTAIAAGVFSFITPKVYKISTSLQINQIETITGSKIPLVIGGPTQILGKINGDVYGVLIRNDLKMPESQYPKIKVDNPEETNLINVEISSSKIELAKSVLEKINVLIINENQAEIKAEKELINKNIELLKQNIETSKKETERINAKIGFLKEEKSNLEAKVGALQKTLLYQQDPGTQFALFNTKEELENKKQEIEDTYLQINSIEEKINSIQNEISSLLIQIDQIKPAEVIKSPIVSEDPVSPKLLLNVTIAAIFGLFLGVFLALLKEWWDKNKLALTKKS